MQKINTNRLQSKHWKKWSIAFKIIPIVLLIAILKFVAHQFSFEVMDLNALFTSLVAGTIFLIGFLSSGVLSDYKESEKIPTELTASLKTLLDDTLTVYKTNESETAFEFIEFQKNFVNFILDWFYKIEKTSAMLDKISSMNIYFVKLDNEGLPAAYIIKMKNEQNAIRKMIMRIDTIRETDFVSTAYAIVEIMGGLIAIGLIIIKIEPFYVSLFFTVIFLWILRIIDQTI